MFIRSHVVQLYNGDYRSLAGKMNVNSSQMLRLLRKAIARLEVGWDYVRLVFD